MVWLASMCELALVAFSSICCCRLLRILVHFSMCCLSLPESTWWSRCAEKEQIKKLIVVRVSLTLQPPARSWHFWTYNFDFPSQRYFSNNLPGYTVFYIPINHCIFFNGSVPQMHAAHSGSIPISDCAFPVWLVLCPQNCTELFSFH